MIKIILPNVFLLHAYMFYVLILVFTCLKKMGAAMAGNYAAVGRANSIMVLKLDRQLSMAPR